MSYLSNPEHIQIDDSRAKIITVEDKNETRVARQYHPPTD